MRGLILHQANSLQVLRGCVKLLPLPQPPLRACTDARTSPSAQRATQLRSVLARVYAVSRQNQITNTFHNFSNVMINSTSLNEVHYNIQNYCTPWRVKIKALNPGLSYMVISRPTTIGCLGHMATIPKKCMNSFLGVTFPSDIKCMMHAYSKKEEYSRVSKRSAWVVYLDKQEKKIKHITDFTSQNEIKNGLKIKNRNNKNYCQFSGTMYHTPSATKYINGRT
jgi:hypothetical protein